MKKFLLFFVVYLFASTVFAATLQPESVDQFFVEPEQVSILRFNIVGDDIPKADDFRMLTAEGKPLEFTNFDVEIDGKSVKVSTVFFQGFWELQCGEQRFGIVSLPKFEGERDKFFAIDGALSWLVGDDELREGLIRSARRVGIGMIRERVSWNAIEKEEGKFDFEADRRYGKLRDCCHGHGIEVLEMFHDAPGWTQKIEKYPGDLVKTAKSWDEIAGHWSHTWGALEIWNEPEISFGAELPADQYVPMVRAIAYRFRTSENRPPPPIVGGVMAHFHSTWLRCAAENGLLHDLDAFSFHTYDRAPMMLPLVEKYAAWMEENGFSELPLWLTECGRPWKRGPERPPVDQDFESAADITMKGIMAKAVGVDRYFPFVYPYYEENDNNFGMMDKRGTPCRSFAAYAQMTRVLSGKEYLASWPHDVEDDAVWRSIPIFDTYKNRSPVTVFMTTSFKGTRTLQLPDATKRVESMTGEVIDIPENKTIPIEPNRIYYVWNDHLWDPYRNTVIRKVREKRGLYRQEKSGDWFRPTRQWNPKNLVSLVPRYQFDRSKVTPSPDGYFIPPGAENPFPLTFRIFNLAETEKKCFIRFDVGTEVLGTKSETIPGQSFVDVTWKLPLDGFGLETGDERKVRLTVTDLEQNHTPGIPVVLYFRGSPTWKGVVSSVKEIEELPVDDMSHWSRNIAGIGSMEMTGLTGTDREARWRMKATFKEGDRWVYPKFRVSGSSKEDDRNETPPVELKKGGFNCYDGLLLWARCTGKARPGVFLFEYGGPGYIVQPAFPADGDWHAVKIPFEKFQHVGATAPDENGKLDLHLVEFLSLGANALESECTLEIRRLALYKE